MDSARSNSKIVRRLVAKSVDKDCSSHSQADPIDVASHSAMINNSLMDSSDDSNCSARSLKSSGKPQLNISSRVLVGVYYVNITASYTLHEKSGGKWPDQNSLSST